MLIKCSKGCGTDVEVSKDMFDVAVARGSIEFSHAVCPNEQTLTNHYRVHVVITRENPGMKTIELARVGASVHSPNLVLAFPPLVELMQENLVKLAGVIIGAEEGVEDEVADEETSGADNPGREE